MIALVLSILSSSIIFAIFKLFDRLKVNTFQAIIVNYYTAFVLGIVLFGNEWDPQATADYTWLYFAFICSLLFISLFLIMGISSQRNGVASTSIAVKMSMAFSILLMIIGYGESINFLKVIGILLAIVGVLLVSWSKNGSNKVNSSWMLLVLFIGSGALDFVLNYTQNILGVLSSSLFTAFGLGMAGIVGSLILIWRLIQRKEKFEWKNLIAGIALGIPNYFSIYLLLLSYQTVDLKDSSVLAITNVGVVISSSLIGFILFKEKHTPKKLVGLAAAVTAIVTLYFAN